MPYDPVGEFFNVDEDSERYLQGIYHSVFSERKVTSDFLLVPKVTYTNIIIYGDHIFDDYDTLKRRNGKDYSVKRYYGYEPVIFWKTKISILTGSDPVTFCRMTLTMLKSFIKVCKLLLQWI